MKAPFRTLYSNDTTNLASCASPFNKGRAPFRPEMLEAAVDETADAGIDVHLLQPGFTWVPWWQSRAEPPAEHYRWWLETYGGELDGVGQFLIDGGDLVEVFVSRCRERGIAPFVSLRLNDYHWKELAYLSVSQIAKLSSSGKELSAAAHSLSRFYLDNPQYCLDPDPEELSDLADPLRIATDPDLRTPLRMKSVLNWKHEPVRERVVRLIRELCENYALDGLELDFIRHAAYFNADETSLEERRAIMQAFIAEVRSILDETSSGARRWLCARSPASLEAYDPLGLEPCMMAEAGVDLLNLSNHYVWAQQTDLSKIAAMVPDSSVYLEMTQATMRRRLPAFDPTRGGREVDEFRMTTAEQFTTGAHLAMARGASGVSVFNFPYYRKNDERGEQAAGEPPFQIFRTISAPDELAAQPQHYFFNQPSSQPPITGPLPKRIEKGVPLKLTFEAVPPRSNGAPAGPDTGWREAGRLRIRADEPLTGRRFVCKINGKFLSAWNVLSEPYPSDFPVGLGSSDELRAWSVLPQRLQDGTNEIELTMTGGDPATIIFMDLSIR